MAVGRHNITLYADEIERTAGAIKTVERDAAGAERAYWLGARNAIELFLQPDIPEDYKRFVLQLKLHFEEVG